MEPDEAEDVRRLMSYEEHTAGGMMTTEPVILSPDATIADALAHVRQAELSPSLAAMVYVVRPPLEPPTGRLLGVAHIQRLLREPPSTLVGHAVDSDVEPLKPSASLEDVARHLATYNLVVLVGDDDRRDPPAVVELLPGPAGATTTAPADDDADDDDDAGVPVPPPVRLDTATTVPTRTATAPPAPTAAPPSPADVDDDPDDDFDDPDDDLDDVDDDDDLDDDDDDGDRALRQNRQRQPRQLAQLAVHRTVSECDAGEPRHRRRRPPRGFYAAKHVEISPSGET